MNKLAALFEIFSYRERCIHAAYNLYAVIEPLCDIAERLESEAGRSDLGNKLLNEATKILAHANILKHGYEKGSKMTAHVYEGQPDARQEGDIKPSRFCPKYRALSDEEKQLHDEIKDKAAELEVLFDKVKDGRYKSLGMTSLEQAVMWVVKELTS